MRLPQARWPLAVVNGSIFMYAVSAAISIAAAQAAVVLASLVWLGRAHRDTGVRLPLIRPIAAFLLAGLVSAAFAADLRLAFFEFGGDWIVAAFFLVCANALGPEPRLTGRVRLLIAASTVSALFAVSQVFTRGLDYRVHGFLGHFNTFGGVLALVTLLAGAQLLYRFRGRQDLWLLSSVGVLLLALTLTQSRGAIGGFLLGAAILLGARDRRLLLLAPLLGAVIVLAAPGQLSARVSGILDLSDITARERVYMWSAGAAMFRAHPLVGVGPGGTAAHYPAFKHPDDPWIHPEPPQHLHNNLVQLAAERGLVGTLPWLWLWLAFFRSAYDIYTRLPPSDAGGRALVLGSLACAAAFLLTGLADYNHGDGEVALLMYFTLALPFAVAARVPPVTAGTIDA